MKDNEPIKREVGLPEIAAGAVTGVAAAAVLSSMNGKAPSSTQYLSPTQKAFWDKIHANIDQRFKTVCLPIVDEFRRLKPPPVNTSDIQAAQAWALEAQEYLHNSSTYKALYDGEVGRTAREELAKAEHLLFSKSGKPYTADDIIKAMDEAKSSALKKPFLAFKSLPTSGKIGVGVVTLASAFGVGYLINKWRNNEDATHVGRMDQERAMPKFRTLSDI